MHVCIGKRGDSESQEVGEEDHALAINLSKLRSVQYLRGLPVLCFAFETICIRLIGV